MKKIIYVAGFMLAISGCVYADKKSAELVDASALNDWNAPQVAVALNWDGFYVGVNGGYLWFDGNSNVVKMPEKGGVAGVQMGYDLQFQNTVLGLETDLDLGRVKSTASQGSRKTTFKTAWLGTFRPLLGFLVKSNWMLFATSGLTYGDVHNSDHATVLTRVGLSAGAGTEWQFNENWSANLMYLYYYLPITTTNYFTNHPQVVRAGINYRFSE